MAIPKLGELRLLPNPDRSSAQPDDFVSAETSAARSFGFLLFACLAAGSLIVGGFSGIRWFLTDVPLTTDRHIEELRTALKTADPANLIREYEDMEKYGLELPEPYKYKIAENAKRAWGRNALVAAAIGLVALLIASILAMTGRNRRRL